MDPGRGNLEGVLATSCRSESNALNNTTLLSIRCGGTGKLFGIVISFLIFFSSVTVSFGQTDSISIPFMEKSPVIDGLVDSSMNAVDWQEFTSVTKSNEKNKEYLVRYKLAYDYRHLYVIIEVDCDSIIIRDRAYQNGDGFHIVIAKPDSGKPTDEFYVLRFSPEDPSKNIPARMNEWYYNIALSWKPLSPATQFSSRSVGGKSYFELLLSWKDVYPYDPLFSDNIGINLCFVKAIGMSEKNYYYLKFDDRIQSELSKRDYLYAKFERPKRAINPFTAAMLGRRNIEAGNPLTIKVMTFASVRGRASYSFAMLSHNDTLSVTRKDVPLNAGMNPNVFELPVGRVAPGAYRVIWTSSDKSAGESDFSVLPQLNHEKEKAELASLKPEATTGSYYTLSFMLGDIFRKYGEIKLYETAEGIGESYESYREYMAKLQGGNDSLSHETGIFRRAFLSKTDTTLQPYTIKVPVNYSPERKYSLLVMLHGSGEGDQDILTGTNLSEGNFIELAPYGRGTSNCFTADGAEIDVKEAIDDAIRNYSIDTSKVVIAGFSMGGYGAYRIFYEYPKLFRGVAVFSGHPSLATKWIGEGFPDFLEDKYLKPFHDVPVFIYHSKNDLNCPYALTEELVAKLRQFGANVEFVTAENAGHGIINRENLPAYYRWLRKLIK